MDQTVYRALHADDLAELLRLYEQLHAGDTPAASDAQRATFDQILASPWLRYVGIFHADRLVATAHAAIVPNLTRGARPYAVIENVVTCASVRRQGFGAQLMRGLMQECWDAGCYKIMLMSGIKRAEVHAFYVALGFSKTDKQAFVISRA